MRITRPSDLQSQPPEAAIAALAVEQHQIMSRAQLLARGVSDTVIRRRLALGMLRREYPGVYAIGGAELSAHGRWLAAVLACGDRAVLSHRSAAALWDLRRIPSGAVDVTLPHGVGARPRGVAVHLTRSLPVDQVAERDGIPCTAVARTLVDLAAVAGRRELARALEQAQVVRRFDLRAIEAALERASGRRGTAVLRRLIAELSDEPLLTRSEIERRFLQLVADAGLPAPVVNALVLGYEVDFHWPRERLIVETDGRETHDTTVAFFRDRERDLQLGLAGWRVIRLTWRQVVDEPERVGELLRRWLRSAA